MENNLTCLSCNYEVDDRENYCANCGKAQGFGRPDRSQSLIFAAVAVLFGSVIYWFFLDLIANGTGNYGIYDTLDWLGYLFQFAGVSVALLAALSMKKSGLKSLAIVFASIYLLIELYWLMKRIFPAEPVDYFQF